MWHTWGLLLGGSWRLDKLKCSHGLKKKSKPRRPLWEEFNDSQSLFWCLPKILFHLHQFLRLPITGEGTHLVKKRCFHVPHYRWAFGKPHHILVLESCVLGICSWGFCNTDAFPACSMIVRCSLYKYSVSHWTLLTLELLLAVGLLTRQEERLDTWRWWWGRSRWPWLWRKWRRQGQFGHRGWFEGWEEGYQKTWHAGLVQASGLTSELCPEVCCAIQSKVTSLVGLVDSTRQVGHS